MNAADVRDRLRTAAEPRRARLTPQEAEVSVAPSFALLCALMLVAIIAQSTVLQSVSLRGAHISLVTVLLVWTGLRCGVGAGGWLGLIAGLAEDALGGSGTAVVGTTLAGYAAGLLSVRFFSDSLPVFLTAVAGATFLRGLIAYLVLEIGLGERGLFHRLSHEWAWQALLNCAVAAVALLVMRVAAHLRRERA